MAAEATTGMTVRSFLRAASAAVLCGLIAADSVGTASSALAAPGVGRAMTSRAPSAARSDTPYPPVTATHGDLVLTLKVSASGATVDARATLTNRGQADFAYFGGCAPPIVQIQARDSSLRHVYGWQKPRTSCFALAKMSLKPGASVKTHARFTIVNAVRVFAQVPRTVDGKKLFATPKVMVVPSI